MKTSILPRDERTQPVRIIEGYPQTPPYRWWELHDKYAGAT